jgi:hypothetical protein
MHKYFRNIEEMLNGVIADINVSGMDAALANRYPVRFVLFDNFSDSFEFVAKMQDEHGCLVESVENWLDKSYNDTMITHSKLASRIEVFINSTSNNNTVIAPFSELARFYDNTNSFEFNTLISTVKAIEASKEGQKNKQRVYIPIVGLEGKMSKYDEDTQAHIWHCKSTDKSKNYRLIITNGTTYDTEGLADGYCMAVSVYDWLSVWRNQPVKSDIIVSSPAIYANAEYANPDNAFTFCICSNVYEFLTDGLHLDFGTIRYKEADNEHWKRLAREIKIGDFSFDKFFNGYFHIDDLADYNVFIKTWFECKNDFEKWLLTNYYSSKFCEKGYICESIKNCHEYTDYEFFESVALAIFDLSPSEDDLSERMICLQQASLRGVQLTEVAQAKLVEKLIKLSDEQGFITAIRYFSPLTNAEKGLALNWLGMGKISKDYLKPFFSDLYYYLNSIIGTITEQWVESYIDEYKKAKISNSYTLAVAELINIKNTTPVEFNSWYQQFKTIKTILNNRSDIEVYYWIDGLGIEWIPLIKQLVNERRQEHIYLNEIFIARAQYPTTTEINKPALLSLSDNNITKKGDLDNYAHRIGNKYPDYIIEEIEIVKIAIKDILAGHAGKKIAIVSDHGLTALSQYCNGLNMGGVESDHSGRIAVRTIGSSVSGNDYILLDDNKTMCALRHNSLCGKTPAGQSAHGGCTPEETLVPIFIISSQENVTIWKAQLLDNEITGTNPIVKYSIKGLSAIDKPFVIYNGKQYSLRTVSDNVYESERLNLVDNETEIKLCIGTVSQTSHLKLNLGAQEDDLFNI